MVRRFLGILPLLPLLASPAQAALDRWSPWGPPTAEVQRLLVDVAAPATLYVQTGTGNLHRSLDGGRTWSWAGRGLASSLVDGFEHGANRRLWVLTRTEGLFRSDDGAATWQRVAAEPQCGGVTLGDPSKFTSFVVVPGTPEALFALCRDQLWQSFDGGQTWRATRLPEPGSSLWVDPHDPRRLALSRPENPLVSRDGGVTWVASPLLPGPGTGRGSLVGVGPGLPAVLFAAVSLDSLDGGRMFRSLDWGATWQVVATTEPSVVVFRMAFDPREPNRLALAGDRLYCSEDGGVTLAPCGPPELVRQVAGPLAFSAVGGILYSSYLRPNRPPSAEGGVFTTYAGSLLVQRRPDGPWNEPQVIATDPPGPFSPAPRFAAGRAYFASGRNLFVSPDGGSSWQGRPPLFEPSTFSCRNNFLIFDLFADPARRDRLLVATQCGLYESLDEGRSWLRRSTTFARSVVALGSQTLLASTCEVARSADGGRTWQRVLPCPPSPGGPSPGETRLLQDPSRPQVIYASTHFGNTLPYQASRRVMRSTDGGLTWRPAVADGDLLAFDPRRTTTLYTVVRGVVLRSTDDGRRWQARGFVVPNYLLETPVAMIVDPANSDRLYARLRSGTLLRSQDGGITWSPAEDGMPRRPTHLSRFTIAADPPGGPGRIFQATDQALYWVKFTD